jgi:thiamine biosynthesis lipoprotein
MHWIRFLAAALLASSAFLWVGEVSGPATQMVYKKRYAMGTVFEIITYGDSTERTSAAVDQALDEVVRLDNVMSNFKAESDLSRMNREAHFRAVNIPPDLYKVIETSLVYSRLSEGQYDVTVGPVVDLWKSALAGRAAPTNEQLQAARFCVGYQKIELIPPDQIEFHSDCMRIDLGSIGKGYAVERAMKVLRSLGIERAYIDAGGSTIYGMGRPPDRDAWLVDLRDPSNRLDPQVKLVDNSVSTSEQTSASTLSGDDPGHIVDPGSGKPLRTRYAVSVTAESATDSDALSTTLLLLGPEKGTALVSQMKGVTAIWISADGQKVIAGSETTIVLGGSNARGVAANGAHATLAKEKKN